MGSVVYSVVVLWMLKVGGGDDCLLVLVGVFFVLLVLFLGVLVG